MFLCQLYIFFWNLMIIDNIADILVYCLPTSFVCFWFTFKICSMTWLNYFNDVYFLCHVTPLILFFKLHRLDICTNSWQDKDFNKAPSFIFLNSHSLCFNTNCQLIALLFSTIPWGLTYSIGCCTFAVVVSEIGLCDLFLS